MGFFSQLTKAVIETALLPVEIVKDAATLGGVCTDRHESYTATRVKNVSRDLSRALESLDD